MSFKKFQRTNLAEMRPYFEGEDLVALKVLISKEDRLNGSPKAGDMVARNPENHEDVWLVAKDYFEGNFSEIEKQISPHQIRVIEESKELCKKADKLKLFFDSEVFNGLDCEEQHLLEEQYTVMIHYSNILTDRIKKF